MSQTYSTQETAKLLGYNRTTLARHVKNGSAAQLRPIIVGRNIRFPKTVIDSMVSNA